MQDKNLPVDLSKLTKEDKKHIVTLLRKRQRAEEEQKLDRLEFSGEPQERFLKSPARIRALFGGNSVGKTASMVLDMLYTHNDLHLYRDTTDIQHTWLIIPSASKAEDYWQEIKKFCPPSLLPQPDRMGTSDIRRFRWRGGKITTIYTHEQDSSKFEGTNIAGAYFDECPKRSQWIATYRGLRASKDYFICIAATPISEPWMYQEIFEPWLLKTDPRIEVIQGSTYENKFISQEWVADFESRLTEDEKRVRIYGEFAVLQGRVFKQFNADTHVIPHQEFPPDWPVFVGIDPHSKKPNVALAVGVTPEDNYVIVDEAEAAGPIGELADTLHTWNKKYNVVSTIIDSSGAALDWSRNSAVQILAANGISCTPVRRADKDVDSGINRIQQLLKGQKDSAGQWQPRLKCMNNCRQTINEFMLYSWKTPKNPESMGDAEQPKKVHDERIDILRYIVNRTPEFQHDLQISSYVSVTPYSK